MDSSKGMSSSNTEVPGAGYLVTNVLNEAWERDERERGGRAQNRIWQVWWLGWVTR